MHKARRSLFPICQTRAARVYRRGMSTPTESNRALWNEWTRIHLESEFYDVAAFKAGANSLWPLEIEEVTQFVSSLEGKRLLHLQCHFGMDTLSWARLGATVTGVDFSEDAVEAAKTLATDIGVDATFIRADVLDIGREQLEGTFDVIYTGGGALNWLRDLTLWGDVIARYLAPGGLLYLREFHPFAYVFADEALEVRHPYFFEPEAMTFDVVGSYADRSANVEHKIEYSWAHPLSEVVSVLAQQGLRIEFLHEHDATREALFEWTQRCDDGLYRAPMRNVPLMYSIAATKAM